MTEEEIRIQKEPLIRIQKYMQNDVYLKMLNDEIVHADIPTNVGYAPLLEPITEWPYDNVGPRGPNLMPEKEKHTSSSQNTNNTV